MKRNITLLSFVFVLIAAATGSALAGSPNLDVHMLGPSAVSPNSPYQYTASIRNTGNQTAQGVALTISLPETDTSPTKYILGTLSGVPTGCALANRKLICNIGALNSGNIPRTFSFNLSLPYSAKVLEIKASATTTSTNETTPANNSESRIPAFNYPSNPLTAASVLTTSCTGRGLTSFFECELFPSSQQSHIYTLNGDSSVVIYGRNVGTWDQPSPSQLHFYMINGGTVIEYNGYATSATCFEGKTTFTPSPSGYMAMYKVCVQ
jgi:uncharacterized repeat protein (TIGR01451 family)